MKGSKLFLALAAVVALLVATASPADASFRLRVEDLSTGVGAVITDGGPGDSSPGANNVIVFVGPIGSFTISVTTGMSTPALASPGFYDAIDLNSVTVSSAAGGTLRLILERDGFTNAPNGP